MQSEPVRTEDSGLGASLPGCDVGRGRGGPVAPLQGTPRSSAPLDQVPHSGTPQNPEAGHSDPCIRGFSQVRKFGLSRYAFFCPMFAYALRTTEQRERVKETHVCAAYCGHAYFHGAVCTTPSKATEAAAFVALSMAGAVVEVSEACQQARVLAHVIAVRASHRDCTFPPLMR